MKKIILSLIISCISVVSYATSISGASSVCVGATTTLSGSPSGGTWSSSITTVATVGSASGLVTTVSPGSTTIIYTLATGCSVTTVITVVAGPSPISGPDSLCVGSVITLSDATAGGTWSSSNTSIATVGSSTGTVTSVSAGTTIITYTASSGCFVIDTITVLPIPCNLGIDKSSIKNNLVEVFPNPAYDELTIKIYPGEYNSFIITNEVGQVMLRAQLKSDQTTVNINALSSGLYYIIVSGDSGQKVLKFVKM